MSDIYFILEDGEQTGPFTFDELIEKGPDIHTRVLSPTEDTWQDACDLPELYDYFKAQGLHFPTESNLASFWWRLLAFIIDFIILSFLMDIIIPFLISKGLISNIFRYNTIQSYSKLPYREFLTLQIAVIATLVIYNTLCEASAMKGSAGKRMCRLAVVDADGMGLSYLNALGRSIGKVVSLSFWGAGFLSIFWSEYRQALHDFLAKTYVIKRD